MKWIVIMYSDRAKYGEGLNMWTQRANNAIPKTALMRTKAGSRKKENQQTWSKGVKTKNEIRKETWYLLDYNLWIAINKLL